MRQVTKSKRQKDGAEKGSKVSESYHPETMVVTLFHIIEMFGWVFLRFNVLHPELISIGMQVSASALAGWAAGLVYCLVAYSSCKLHFPLTFFSFFSIALI